MQWDIPELVRTVGYIGVFSIVFAESGLLVGFFLPGDSLLFTAGFLASQGYLSLPILALGCIAAAVSGDAVGYSFGRRMGRKLFERPDSRWFKREHLFAAEAFYEKHGGKAIVIARFLPVVRTFAPIVAGMANMRYRRFALFNLAGGILWAAGLTTGGYALGSTIPDVDRYLLPIILCIVVVSALPSMLHIAKAYRGEVASLFVLCDAESLLYSRLRRATLHGKGGMELNASIGPGEAQAESGFGMPNRNWVAIPLVSLLALPWFGVWAGGFTPEPLVVAALTGLAILGAAFLLSWAAEALQLDVSQAFALGLLALIAVLPEYAVDAVFAWKAAEDPSYMGYPVANMTGSNRLLIGVGWSAVVLVSWLRFGARKVELGRGNALELTVLIAATLYAFIIPLKGSLSLLDTAVLGAMFVFYVWATSRAPSEEPHLVGPAKSIGELPLRRRRLTVWALFLYAAAVILISAKPFAQSLVQTGTSFGIDEFLLVQWLAPLASESPEFIVAILFAWRAQASAGMRTMVSSKVNQWTLLIATLPLIYSIAKGGPSSLPLDSRQTEELFLTASQSLFAIVLISKLAISRKEALLLFGLFAVQLVIPNESVRNAVAALYLALSGIVLLRSREARHGLLSLPALLCETLGICLPGVIARRVSPRVIGSLEAPGMPTVPAEVRVDEREVWR